MKKTEIQERVRCAHETLLKALDGLTEEEATRLGLTSEWSIRDALSHIAAWEFEGARIVGEIQAGRWKPTRLEPQYIDDFNARAVDERRDRTYAEVQAEFVDAHSKMESTIASLPDEVDEKSPAYKFVEGVTFRHHAHHAKQIEEFRNK